MKSRRRTLPSVQDLRRQCADYSSNLRPSKWGSAVKLRCKISRSSMSALVHPSRFERSGSMSAIALIVLQNSAAFYDWAGF
jgi:hypothetical protein